MKRIITLFILSAVMLTACGTNRNAGDDDTNGTSPATSTAAVVQEEAIDYFPFAENTHMLYKGTGNEYAAYETYVDYLKDDVMQVRQINAGTVMALVYKFEDGAIKRVFSKEEAYYRHDFTDMAAQQEEIIIKEPIAVGTSWTLEDGSTRSITDLGKEVETPLGSFTALEVTTTRQDATSIDYYVKGTGLVKSEYNSADGSFSIVSELEKMEEDVPLKQNVRLYYPDFNNDRLVYIDRVIEVRTNQDTNEKISEELKTIPENSELSKVLSENTKILGYAIDESAGTVTIDFSPELVTEMNAGTGLEGMLLDSITNTFGVYYQKDRVALTMEGKPYESGHFLLEPGEYFTVKTDNITEYEP